MLAEELKFSDGKLYVYTPVPHLVEGMSKVQLVMTKEIFQECYNRWIKPLESGDKKE